MGPSGDRICQFVTLEFLWTVQLCHSNEQALRSYVANRNILGAVVWRHPILCHCLLRRHWVLSARPHLLLGLFHLHEQHLDYRSHPNRRPILEVHFEGIFSSKSQRCQQEKEIEIWSLRRISVDCHLCRGIWPLVNHKQIPRTLYLLQWV